MIIVIWEDIGSMVLHFGFERKVSEHFQGASFFFENHFLRRGSFQRRGRHSADENMDAIAFHMQSSRSFPMASAVVSVPHFLEGAVARGWQLTTVEFFR